MPDFISEEALLQLRLAVLWWLLPTLLIFASKRRHLFSDEAGVEIEDDVTHKEQIYKNVGCQHPVRLQSSMHIHHTEMRKSHTVTTCSEFQGGDQCLMP